MKTLQTSRVSLFALLMLLTFGLTACDDSSIAGLEVRDGTDIIDVASAPDFSTLTAAIEAAALTETLRSEGPFTVFAPTNEAFAKLPPSAIRTLLLPENQQQLADVLTFHVVPGEFYANEILQRSSAKTASGSDLTFNQEGGDVFVNEARITATDIEATNGLVHVIDTVLLPDWFGEWISRNDVGIDPLDQE